MKTFVLQIMMFSLFLTNTAVAQMALDFDGVDDNVTSAATLNQDDNFTLEAYVQYRTNTGFQTVIGFGVAVEIKAYNNTVIYLSENNTADAIGSSVNMVDGQWYHLALVRDSGSWKVYVDGVYYEFSQKSAPTPEASDTFRVGGRGTIENWNGVIEEVRVWTVARSQADIQKYMHRCLTGQEAGLYLYYRMDDGPGSATVTDLTDNGNDGTLNNMDVATAWLSGIGIDCSGLDEMCVPVKAKTGVVAVFCL